MSADAERPMVSEPEAGSGWVAKTSRDMTSK
jgi:hypothetical protein